MAQVCRDGLTKGGDGARKIGRPLFSVPSLFSRQNKAIFKKRSKFSINVQNFHFCPSALSLLSF